MNLRFWLRNNFLRRKLRLLTQRVQAKLFSSLRLPSLLPRSPSARSDDLTVSEVTGSELHLRVFSSERVRLDESYRQWIGPLLNLPAGSTISDLKQAAEKLPGYNSQPQYFFPATAYLKAMAPTAAKMQVSWAHRCRATKPVKLKTEDPATLLVYSDSRTDTTYASHRSRSHK